MAQGTFLTQCSDESSRGRNSGIFWGLFQLNAIVGNFTAAIILSAQENSSFLFFILTLSGCSGIVVLLLLRPVQPSQISILFPKIIFLKC